MELQPLQTLAETVRSIATATVAQLPQIVVALLVLLLTAAVVRGVRWIVRRFGATGRLRRALIEVLQMLASTGIWLGGTLVALTIAFPSITPAKALTALGLGSVAIGFAFKDVLENFLAGLLILLREPFRLSDFIESDGVEGLVERITVRDSHLRQTDGQLVVVPNAILYKNPVTVRTDRDLRRTSIVCGVAYAEDADAAREVILAAVQRVDSVRDDVRDVQVFAQAFGASSIDFEIAWWTGSKPLDIRASRDEVVRAIKRALDDAGIEIPFPHRTLTFRSDSPLAIGSDTDSGASSEE